MSVQWTFVLAAFIVGLVVGVTGMGGGALMTPILVILFHVPATVAISSDLVASVMMRPLGAAVHLRRRTVQGGLVLWLAMGSVPCAFVGVLLTKLVAHGRELESVVAVALGAALVTAAAALVARTLINLRHRARRERLVPEHLGATAVRPVPTLLIGALGGLMVGMTSVGAGSLIIALLLVLYPRLTAAQLVGTDLVQALPLVGAAALGHLLFGDVHFSLTLSLVVGSVPGVFVGAQVSSLAPSRVVRGAIAVALVASGLKLLGLGNLELGGAIVASLVLAAMLWFVARRTDHVIARRQRLSPEPYPNADSIGA